MKPGVTDSATNPVPASIYAAAALAAGVPAPDFTNGTRLAVVPEGQGIQLKVLRQVNPEYSAGYWARLRAFYRGGRSLLGDERLLNEVFPPHRNETDAVYKERLKRAVYVPYAGEIVNHIIAALTAEPLAVTLDDGEKPKPGAAGATAAPNELPEFYEDFIEDCSPQGGQETNINQLVRATILEALQVRQAWVLYDLEPARDAAGEPVLYSSKLEQDKAGMRNVYAQLVPAECIIDWEEDASGELEWALFHTVECKRGDVRGSRNVVTERWTYFTRMDFEKYEISYPRADPPDPQDDRVIVRQVDAGPHTHGKVPLCRLQVPEGLWVMEKLENLAREHFNKRSALSWAEFQSLLPELYEFLAAEQGGAGANVGENQEDPARAVNQQRGQGYTQVRGGDDTAKFIGPDSAPFDHALTSCKDVRDEMHRVTHQMKLAVDNTAAAMTRSGESKEADKNAEDVVLTYLGLLCREFLRELMQDVSRARNEMTLIDSWRVKGMEKFDETAVDDVVNTAVALEGVDIPSPTFKRLSAMLVVRARLGDTATPDDLAKIAEELESNVTDDQFDPAVVADQDAATADAQRQHELALKATVPGGKPGGGGAPAPFGKGK